MSRIFRRTCACLAIATLAFSQLAVSAHACPMEMAASEQAASAMDAGDCDMPVNPNLCERHCNYGASSVQSGPPAAMAPDLVALPWRLAPFVALPFHTAVREWLLPTRIEPPPLQRFGVLRI